MKIDLRAKQLSKLNEDELYGSSTAQQPGNMGVEYVPMNVTDDVATLVASSENKEIKSSYKGPTQGDTTKPEFTEWVEKQFPALKGSEGYKGMGMPETQPHGGETMRGVSQTHRWGRVFAERAPPLSGISAAIPNSYSASAPPTPLQRRPALRRRRIPDSGEAVWSPVGAETTTTSDNIFQITSPVEGYDVSPDISPIFSRGSNFWSPTTPATAISQENKPLPLSYRLPLTPTKTSPIGIAPPPSSEGLPRIQDFPIPPLPSSSLSVPNSPASPPINLFYQPRSSRAPGPLHFSSPRRVQTDPDHIYNNTEAGNALGRPVTGLQSQEPRPRASIQSSVISRTLIGMFPNAERSTSYQSAPAVTPDSWQLPASPMYAVACEPPPAYTKKAPKERIVRLRCRVCMEKHRVGKMIQVSSCLHFFCKPCMTGM